MLDTYLVALKTVATAKGDGAVVDIGPAQNRVFLLQLEITGAVEQEAIEVSIYGGPEEAGIGKAPIAVFPQRFYAGSYPFLLDLQPLPEIKAVRAHWEVNRWGRGSETPRFEFGLRLMEVSPELLHERESR